MNVPERGRFSISILLSLSLSCTPFASGMLANVAFHRIPLDRGTQSNYAVKCRNKPIAGKGETQSKSNQWIDDHAYMRHGHGQSTMFCANRYNHVFVFIKILAFLLSCGLHFTLLEIYDIRITI